MMVAALPFRYLRVLAWLRARGGIDTLALASFPLSAFLIGLTVALAGQ